MVGLRNNIIMDLNRLFVIALVTCLLAALSLCSPDDQCRFVFKEDYVLDVTQSEENGAIVRRSTHARDKLKCAEKCCDEDGTWCTLAVFHQGTRDMNCFLVQCIPDLSDEDACVSRHLRKSGFTSVQISRHISSSGGTNPGRHQFITTTTEATRVATKTSSFVKVTTPKTTPTTTAATTAATTTTTTTRTTTQIPTTTTHPSITTSRTTVPREESKSTPIPSWTIPGREETIQRTNGSGLNHSLPETMEHSANYTEEKSGDHHDNDIQHVDKTELRNENHQSVTSTGILIATFCFGLIFFLAVVVVLGKRWHESYKRRHYSKVNYLINGMYS